MTDHSARKSSDPGRDKARLWLFLPVVALGLALPLAYAVYLARAYDAPIDFQVFWVAGQVWAEGGNPYASSFTETANTLVGSEISHRWLYSPYIWVLSRPLAAFSFETAFIIWTCLSVALFYGGVALVSMAAFDLRRPGGWLAAIAVLVATMVSTAAAGTLTIGQFSAFTFFGAAAFAHAVVLERRWLMVPALFILAMKASLGLPFIAFALAAKPFRMPALVAFVAAMLFSVPALVSSGIGPAVAGFLEGLAVYPQNSANSAQSMTGLRNLAYYLAGVELSGAVLALAASAGAAGLAWAGRPREACVAALALIFFLVPMHLYDLALVSVLAIGVSRRWFAILYGLVLVGLFRVTALSGLLGIPDAGDPSFQGSLLASLFLGALLLASIVPLYSDAMAAGRKTKNRQSRKNSTE